MFTTVFEISYLSHDFIPMVLSVIVGLSVFMCAAHFDQYRKSRFINVSPKIHRIIRYIIYCFSVIIFLTVMCVTLFSFNKLYSAYKNSLYEIVEGRVIVFHEQPEWGHDSGDEIKIGDTKFIVDMSDNTNAYQKPISHGGVLKDGVYARVCHYKGKILRVDIKEE